MGKGGTGRIGAAVWVAITWVALACLAVPAAGATEAEAVDCTVYAYIDSSGQLVKTISRSAVPPAHQSSMMTFDDCEQARALSAQGGSQAKDAPPIYTVSTGQERPAVQVGRSEDWPKQFFGWFSGLSPWQGILLIFCWAIGFAGGLGMIVLAFRTSIWWGLGSLFVPFVGLIFVILYWRITWPSFLANLVCGVASGVLLFVWSAPLPVPY